MEKKGRKDWNRLLKSRCPNCNKYLWFDKDDTTNPWLQCTLECGFQIKIDRMQEIIMELTTRKLDWSADIEGLDNNQNI